MTYLNIFHLIKNDDIDNLSKVLKNEDVDLNQHLLPSMLNDDVSLSDCIYYTPLYLATKMNKTEIMDLLLEHGANARSVISEKNGLFVSPYDLTILNNRPDLTEKLSRYVEHCHSLTVIRTKTRSEKTTSFNFRRQKIKADQAFQDYKTVPENGISQKF